MLDFVFRHQSSVWVQMKQNVVRNWINTMRDSAVLAVLFVAALVLGLIFGTLYFQKVRHTDRQADHAGRQAGGGADLWWCGAACLLAGGELVAQPHVHGERGREALLLLLLLVGLSGRWCVVVALSGVRADGDADGDHAGPRVAAPAARLDRLLTRVPRRSQRTHHHLQQQPPIHPSMASLIVPPAH